MSAFAHLSDEKAKEAREILDLLYEFSQCLCDEVIESSSEAEGQRHLEKRLDESYTLLRTHGKCKDKVASGLVRGVRSRVLWLLKRERSRTA